MNSSLDSYKIQSSISECRLPALEKMEIERNYRLRLLHSKIVWTLIAVICSPLYLELTIVSKTVKINPLGTLKQMGSGLEQLLQLPREEPL